MLLRTFGEGARSKCFLDHRCLLRGCHLKELRSKAVARYSHGMALTEGERPKKELKEKELSGNVLPAESVEEGRELSGGGPRSGPRVLGLLRGALRVRALTEAAV